MSENKKLRALLVEARDGLFDPDVTHDVPRCPCWVCNLARRIDAALAEPIRGDMEASASRGWQMADSLHLSVKEQRERAEKAERERDEARAEVERLRKERDAACMAAGDYSQDDVNEMTTDMIALRKEYEKNAYQRGAEAMREAAAQEADKTAPPKSIGRDHGRHHIAGAQQAAARIRALPIPEDKP